MSFSPRIVFPRAVLLLGLVIGVALAVPAASQASPYCGYGTPPTGGDDEVVLPSRVDSAIKRTERSVCKAEEHVDEGEYAQAAVSLRSVRRNMYRADRAARRQMNIVPDPNAEDETTPGPDAVIAVLGVDSEVVTSVSGLFDANSKGVVDAATHALFRTLNARDRLLDAVIALDPEGAGAGYSDGMADTVDGYTDEVDNITDAIADDTLSAGGTKVLQSALTQVTATSAKVTAAFGGGE
jgi:hypothetical protein